jgi:predicted amidohydrolase
MSRDSLTVALVTDVFHDETGDERLLARLREARALGAELAILPELPLNSWCPAGRTTDEKDAEPPDGRRQQAMARAARAAGLALLGGAIVRDPATGRRHNTALLFDAGGAVLARYQKLHVPWEEGYWEADHYEAGDEPPEPVDVGGFPVGIQICSDVNRPEATHALGARGALALLAPRATPPQTWERWRIVLRANAVTSSLYVVSVNRPLPEPGTSIGGPSLVVAPDGSVVAEGTDPVMVARLERSVVEAARRTYPGYLAVRSDLYARAWSRAPIGEARSAPSK